MRLASPFAAILCFAVFVPAFAADTIRPSDRIVAGDQPGTVRHLPSRLAELRPRRQTAYSEPTVCPDSLDMLHYELHINVDRPSTTLDGDAFLTFRSLKDGLTGVRLDFRQLTVTSVLRGGLPLAYTHTGDTLWVTLDSALALGDTAVVEIVYGGVPDNEGPGGFGGFWFFPYPITDFSMGVGLNAQPPSMGRYWFPGVDAPCDKATCEIFVETPGPKFAVSNGILISTTQDSVTGRKTYQWREDHPIATYLMAISVAKYNAVADTVNPLITYYVHRNLDSLALPTFQNVHYMMEGFESLFGPYPYDKFSFVTTPIGDMEHQTCVFHSNMLMSGDTTYDDILAHELFHQWFGDLVTYGDWRDVWLSEGFATYGEALHHEYLYGVADYHDYVKSRLMGPYLNNAANLTYPIYDPDFLWGVVAYEKGGTVLHMLRHVMGDPAFFAGMNAYLAAHQFGNAETPDFRVACEGEYGSSLAWFFDEWIYSGGHPVFDWGWDYADLGGGLYRVDIETRQVQTVGPVYTMPVDLRIETTAGDTTVVGWVDALSNSFSFLVGGEPTAVVFDPDNWLLDEANEVPTGAPSSSLPIRFALGANRPNPFNPVTIIPFSLPANRRVTLQIYSTRGRLVRTLLDRSPLSAGDHTVRWNGTDLRNRSVASGVYFYSIVAGEKSQTRKMQLLR